MKKLFTPDVKKIGRPEGNPMADAVPDTLADGTPSALRDAMIGILGKEKVKSRVTDLVRFASDASPYRYIPQVVVLPSTVEDIVGILAYCRREKRHATFRSSGTSLNGQSQSDDVLIEVRRHWNGCKVEENGRLIRVKTGTILAHANLYLAPYGRRIGPDPASARACTVGGVISNNAGGMRCTVDRDSYHTVKSMTFVMPSGTVIDTSAADAAERFEKAEPLLTDGLMKLRSELLADSALTERVRKKFTIRNTHGYRLCALLDAESPLEIFRRLLIGSEGTLAFIAEASFETVPINAVSGVAWLLFESIDAAISHVKDLTELGATAVEMMIAPALTAAAEIFAGTPSYWKTLDPKGAALLVEIGARNVVELEVKEAEVRALLADAELLHPIAFTSVTEAVELAWQVREGLAGLVGKSRPPGSMMINEDVCFPPERLAEAAHDLQALLQKHGFVPGLVGHAAHGNLHFPLVANFENEGDRARYSGLMSDLVELVVKKYDGSLKAEHGTGMNMAPFLEAEWGEKATSMMWRIKELADPHGVLGPNVILSRDPQVHMSALKSMPVIENVSGASQCIECGFCEPVCPSRNVTTTPRQRIALRREMARQPENSRIFSKLLEDYEYDAIETCAGDGSCSIPCPIGINTGALMREFRKAEHGERAEAIALGVAKKWENVERLSRASLSAAEVVTKLVGVGLLKGMTAVARSAISEDLFPAVPGPMPRPAGPLPPSDRGGAAAVYFPACINRMFGRDPEKALSPSLPEALVTVSARAGHPLWIPDDVVGVCCASPFSSKGYSAAHDYMSREIINSLWRWSDAGRLPIVVDAASCTLAIVEGLASQEGPDRERLQKIRVLDSIQWCHELLPNLQIDQRLGRILLHPTCSTTHLGLNNLLREIADHLAEEVEIPIGATCCGTAGDRGLLHPELVRSATREEAAWANEREADAYISANRTCEMGMRHSTGRPYESFVFLLEEFSRPKSGPGTALEENQTGTDEIAV